MYKYRYAQASQHCNIAQAPPPLQFFHFLFIYLHACIFQCRRVLIIIIFQCTMVSTKEFCQPTRKFLNIHHLAASCFACVVCREFLPPRSLDHHFSWIIWTFENEHCAVDFRTRSASVKDPKVAPTKGPRRTTLFAVRVLHHRAGRCRKCVFNERLGRFN